MEPWHTRRGQPDDFESDVGSRAALKPHKGNRLHSYNVPGPGSYFIKPEQDPNSPLGPHYDKYTSFKTQKVTGGSLATNRTKEMLNPQFRDRMSPETGGGCAFGKTTRLAAHGKRYNKYSTSSNPSLGYTVSSGSDATDSGTAPNSYRHACSLGSQNTSNRPSPARAKFGTAERFASNEGHLS